MMGAREPVAMEIPVEEGPAAALRVPPRRIRRRLMEGARGGGAPASVEEIEARLREAELRRQVRVPVALLFFFSSSQSSWYSGFCCFLLILGLGCVAGA